MTLHRCRCNAVSSPKIATHAGDFKGMKFHKDPNNPEEMICDDCYQALEDVNSEWMDLDDVDLDDWWGDDLDRSMDDGDEDDEDHG